MSFGFSVGDCILLLQIARDSYENCRAAGSEYTEIAREVKSLYSVLKILRDEAEKTESPLLRRESESMKTELSLATEGCKHILEDLQTLLARYKGLSGDGEEKVNAGRKLWHRIRFGSKIQALAEVRRKIITYTSTITVLLDAMQLKATGRLEDSSGRLEETTVRIEGTTTRVEGKINEIANTFLAMRNAIVNDELRARAQPRGSSNISLMSLSTYNDDDKVVWQEFRREMAVKGFKSHHLERHKDILRAYMLKLAQCGVLDQLKLQADVVQPWWMQLRFLETSETLPGLTPIIEDESSVREKPESGNITVPRQPLSPLPTRRRVRRDTTSPNPQMERILAAKLEPSTSRTDHRVIETSTRGNHQEDIIAGATPKLEQAGNDTATHKDNAPNRISHQVSVPSQPYIGQRDPLFKVLNSSHEMRTSSRENKFAYAESVAESEPERQISDPLSQGRRVLIPKEDQGKGPSPRNSKLEAGPNQEIPTYPERHVTPKVRFNLPNREPKIINEPVPVRDPQPPMKEKGRQRRLNRNLSPSDDSESESWSHRPARRQRIRSAADLDRSSLKHHNLPASPAPSKEGEIERARKSADANSNSQHHPRFSDKSIPRPGAGLAEIARQLKRQDSAPPRKQSYESEDYCDSEDSAEESTDSSMPKGEQDMSRIIMQQTAKAALLAGMTEAFRVRNHPGDWGGLKGRRVLSAALGAAEIETASRT
ncbi:hypothetical protein BP5796_08231 [Coleophoma crateriformis]|uniref:Fungal N-terminal domain-containing protein n=1 Tax=Coleophoma crateriformis TaxID=565419 RepID=A0A3D8RDR0_9HELO|nr:hypothetical protein BP5796_08231 [Coleophoma crateriformis]